MYIERESQNIERPLLPVPAFSTQELLPVCEQSVSCMQVSLLVCEWLVLLSLVLLFLRVSSSTIQFLDVLKLACWWHVEPQHYNSAEKLDAQAVSLGGLRANGKKMCVLWGLWTTCLLILTLEPPWKCHCSFMRTQCPTSCYWWHQRVWQAPIPTPKFALRLFTGSLSG